MGPLNFRIAPYPFLTRAEGDWLLDQRALPDPAKQ